MSGILPAAVHRAKAAMTPGGDKIADMARNTIEPSDQDTYTTDWGVREPDNNDWLKVASGDKTGPMLLEDVFAREKASKQHSITWRSAR